MICTSTLKFLVYHIEWARDNILNDPYALALEKRLDEMKDEYVRQMTKGIKHEAKENAENGG